MLHWPQRVPVPPATPTSAPVTVGQGELVARTRGISFNSLVVDSLAAEVERAKNDPGFIEQARSVIERNREILDRLATQ